MRARGYVLIAVMGCACGARPTTSTATATPTATATATAPPTAPSTATAPATPDAGASTGHVDDGVIAKLFDRVYELLASRIREAAGAKYASRADAKQTLDQLLSEWTHFSGMTDVLSSVGATAGEVEAYLDQHPSVLKRQAARIAERLREPMHDFEEAIDKQFPRRDDRPRRP